MNIEHIIIQAGGKGTRMKSLSRNRPKPLIPVRNLPIIFHLFRSYPDAHFTIIGDYKYDVMQRYLAAFAEVDYSLVNGAGKQGTCGGLSEALNRIPESSPFMLIWGDLVLPNPLDISHISGCALGISTDFECRWMYKDGVFSEDASKDHGVAGLFLFDSKSRLAGVPQDGEFVRWLSTQDIPFQTISLTGTKEYGIYDEYKAIPAQRCRPFNRISIRDGVLVKEGIDEQGRDLAKKEIAWYEKLIGSGFRGLPTIYEFNPLKMELIDGKNIYEYDNLPFKERRAILDQIIDCLQGIHSRESVKSDYGSYYDAYIGKTFKRLEKVYDLVPFAKDEAVLINGVRCPTPFTLEREIEEAVNRYFPDQFALIHGDCTFSNIMLRSDGTPVLIDPRGYFGKTQFYGDAAYDWAKLYYSLVGDYDQFNLKRFELIIGDTQVNISIRTNGWRDLEEYFFERLDGEVTRRQMRIFHAIIWLSLTTYAWEDYDSICGAFYIGCMHLKEALR